MQVIPILTQNVLKTSCLAVLAAILWLVIRLWSASRRLPGMPPGPPTIPFLGNAHQIPQTGIAKKYVTMSIQPDLEPSLHETCN